MTKTRVRRVSNATPVSRSGVEPRARALANSSTRASFLSLESIEPSWDPTAHNSDLVFHQDSTPSRNLDKEGENLSRPGSPDRLAPVDRHVGERVPTPGRGQRPSLSLPQSPTGVERPTGIIGLQPEVLARELTDTLELMAAGGQINVDENLHPDGDSMENGAVDPNSPAGHILRAEDLVTITSLEFETFDPGSFSSIYLETLTKQLDERKVELMSIYTKLSCIPSTASLKDEVQAALQKVIKVIGQAQSIVTIREVTARRSVSQPAPTAPPPQLEPLSGAGHSGPPVSRPASAASSGTDRQTDPRPTPSPAPSSIGSRFSEATLDFKRKRVLSQEPRIDGDMSDLIAEMKVLMRNNPTSDKQARDYTDRVAAMVRRVNSLDKDAQSLCQDALDADLADKAADIDSGASLLRTTLRELEYRGEKLKSDRGLSAHSDIKGTDLAPPTFNGQPGEDVYDFLETLDQFLDSRNYSNAQVVRMVKMTCLRGQVQRTCRYMDGFDDIKKYLVDTYGQPRVLFDAKLKEFSKVGKCPSAPASRTRDWYLDVIHQLRELLRVAEKYNLSEDLKHSTVMTLIHTSLPNRVEMEFLDKLADKGISCLDKSAVFNETIEYLEELVVKTTEKVSYHLMLGVKDVEKVIEKNGQRRTYAVEMVPIDEKTPPTSPQPVPKKQNTAKRKKQQQAASNVAINASGTNPKPASCVACEEEHVFHFECPLFQAAAVKERYAMTKAQGSCMRCLRMDAALDLSDRRAWWEQHEPSCQTEWFCTANWCTRSSPRTQQHITMCANHYKQNQSNGKLEQFVKALDPKVVPPSTRFFFSQFNMTAAAVAPRHTQAAAEYEIIRSSKHPAIYLLQDVYNLQGEKLTLFFDTGCSAAAISTRAANILGTVNVRPGPTKLTVAGGGTITIDGGVDSFLLDLFKPRTKAEVEGLVMDEVTSPLNLHLLSDAYKDICSTYEEEYGDLDGLPTVPESVGGGRVDLMVGILYPHLFPEKVFSLNCGLEIYKTPIRTLSGHHGVLGGPHSSWVKANERADYMNPSAFLTAEMRAYRHQSNILYFNALPSGPVMDKDEPPSLPEDWNCSGHHCCLHQDKENWSIPSHWILTNTSLTAWEDRLGFEGAEASATEASYRCLRCRNCSDCRKGEALEAISLQEEVEQALIESSVWYDDGEAVLKCKLPFIKDPSTHLVSNATTAEKIFLSQMKAISRNPAMREAVLQAHNKLLLNNFVCKIEDLDEDEKEAFDAAKGEFVVPWSCVSKLESVSTPYRIVFNGSHKTRSGDSLNSTLAKGANRLPQIFQLLVKFASRKFALTADVSMAYNSIKLMPAFYRYQQYLWKPTLDPEEEIDRMVIRTLIYGIKPSGNMTQAGFEKTAQRALLIKPELSPGAKLILNNTYVDDTVASMSSLEQCNQAAECMAKVLDMAQIKVKDFTFSGTAPSEKVSSNGKTLGVLGYVWDPVMETIALASKPLVLGNSRRGKKPAAIEGEIKPALSERFTRRVLTGLLAGIFDPKGLVTPITAQLKFKLSQVVDLKPAWDEPLPRELLDTWANSLADIRELQALTFHRSFVHPEAVSEQVELIVSVDASQYVAVAAVHARSKMPDGTYSCRLVAGKSKLTKLATIPRGELKAAVMGASVAHAVQSALGDQVDNVLYVSDSTIVLYWINQDARPLQTAVRNGVIEIRRLSQVESWFHIPSEDNIADLGTRTATVHDLDLEGEWVCGKKWMSLDMSQAPLRSIQEVQLDQDDLRAALKEVRATETCAYALPQVTDKLETRYAYSKYVVDPCVLAWHKSIRVLAFVLRFIAALKAAVSKAKAKLTGARAKRELPPRREQPPRACKRTANSDKSFFLRSYKISFKCRDSLKDFRLDEQDTEKAEQYFFRKATKEVKQFAKKKDYFHCTKDKDGILMYVGRILDNQTIEDLDNVLGEVSPLFFSRPVVDRHSPIAYAVMMYAHEKLLNHMNPVATLRESRAICFILQGRDLAIEVVEACITCRRSKAVKIQQEFGKVHPATLSVTPAFYRAQVDLAGPWWATCEHSCRSAVKVWAVVFRDPASCATAVYAMQSSTSSAFVQAYSRHSFRYGHPIKLYIDAGSQLLKAVKEASFTWHDVHAQLTGQYRVGIDYEVCPPHAHYFHGSVERSILEIKKILDKVFSGFKMSLFSYETAFSFCANQLNDLPICVGSRTDHLGNRDILTPNRLLLGRNNKRAPSSMSLTGSSSSIIQQMKDVQEAWWRVWFHERIEDYIPSPKKWREAGKPVKQGDIVLFPIQKQGSEFTEPAWKTGRILRVCKSHDGAQRRVVIIYRNNNEEVNREVERGVREVAVLHREEDFELVSQLSKAAEAVVMATTGPEARPESWNTICSLIMDKHECEDDTKIASKVTILW